MSASLHALPACEPERIFELRRAARESGAQFTRHKPRAVATKPTPIGPNDGGRAA
ncbi:MULTISPECIES: hypothetical protein [unclassified Pseudomonas]|uniref:hypothetical protein n=1 Tax=unclassified Pseudomonas TaxID=196821 RepID=UPI0024484893|nr:MULTISPECIES: hypothetical protein [unclassified Pseudomonas]MDG9925458.1 hypothetical protein [Pseudomonas sp. GD04045]MDH0034101.1 hypothetical protein [Pseudomonas sp. GD04019]